MAVVAEDAEMAEKVDQFRDICGRHRAADLLTEFADGGRTGGCMPIDPTELGMALARIGFNHPEVGGEEMLAQIVRGFKAYGNAVLGNLVTWQE